MMTFMFSSCVRGYLVYKDVWNPSVGETVNCECEGRNPEDPYEDRNPEAGIVNAKAGIRKIPTQLLCGRMAL